MPLRRLSPLLLVFALAGCQTAEPEDVLAAGEPVVAPTTPPQQFSYVSPSQTRYNPFSVDIWSQPNAAGVARSYVRVAAPGIRIGSPQHEAVARAVVVEVASERLCTGGTVPTFQQQYGHDVYLNERVEKWGAIVSCETPSFAPQEDIAPLSNMASEFEPAPVPATPQTPGVFDAGPLPPAGIGSAAL